MQYTFVVELQFFQFWKAFVFRYVLNDEKNVEMFVAYFVLHLPDISDFPSHIPEELHFWKMGKGVQRGKRGKKLKGGKARGRAHAILTGLHSTRTNDALEYCIKNNKWCVKFEEEDIDGKITPYNLITDFTVRFWLKYIAGMVSILKRCFSTPPLDR